MPDPEPDPLLDPDGRPRASDGDAPAGGSPLRPGVTLFCLLAWLLLTATNKLAQLALDPVAQFSAPVDVAVRASEGPLELLEGFERATGQELSGPFDAGALAGDVAEAHAAAHARLEVAVDAGTTDVDQADLVELRVRAAVLEAMAGGTPRLFDAPDLEALAEDRPAVEAVLVAFGERATERPDALLEAAEGLRPGPARRALLERLGERLGRAEQVEPDLAAAREAVDARVERGLELLGFGLPLALLGLVVLGLLAFLPARQVRLDPPDRPHRWPSAADGLGLFARYALAFVAIQSVLALTVGTASLGWSAAASSAPLLLVAAVRYGGLAAAARPLGGGLARDRVGRLFALPLGAWVGALIALFAVATVLSGGRTDPFANPFLEILADADRGLRLRLLVEACLWAPIFEELAFRAALFGGLRARLPFLPAAALSSVVFGAAHAYDAVGITSIVAVGFVLAWLYERTRSIWACMLAHALFNFGQLQLAFLIFG